MFLELGRPSGACSILPIFPGAYAPGYWLEHGYNLLMPRTALFALLVASVLGGSFLVGSSQAQRATATFHGNAGRSPGRSGFVGQRGSANRFGRSHFHHDGGGAVWAPYFFPYDEPVGYEQPYPEPLDIEATTAANHERGIDLRIPADRNEISLSF